MAELILVRHTRPDVDPGVCYGRLDVPLASTWMADIGACLSRIPQATRVYSSPSTRCQVLAEALCGRDRRPLQLDNRLLEVDFGKWEGLPWDTVPREDLTAWAESTVEYAPGGGETLAMVWRRTTSFCDDLRFDAEDVVVVVTHHGPIRAIAARLEQRETKTFFDLTIPFGALWHRAIASPPLR